MRMWLTNPRGMCRKHLLGEHVEMHMFVGAIRKRKSLTGYLRSGLLEPALLLRRHDALAREMTRRGYRHESPLAIDDEVRAWVERHSAVIIDKGEAEIELRMRCQRCAEGMG